MNRLHKLKIFVLLTLIFAVYATYGQPNIPEDRMYLKVSPDFVKVEQDIYHPAFSGKKPEHFIRWEYIYKNGHLLEESSFFANRPGKLESKTTFKYNNEGKLISDSSYLPCCPALGSQTQYEYNNEGRLAKAIKTNDANHENKFRIDTYKKYKNETTYQIVSQFFGDNNKESVKYTSVFENGLKQTVIHNGRFSPVKYEYDSTGKLIAKNSRKYFYKLDERGNAIASVAIEYGMRIYNFIRLTYADGTVTGSLEPNEAFIKESDSFDK